MKSRRITMAGYSMFLNYGSHFVKRASERGVIVGEAIEALIAILESEPDFFLNEIQINEEFILVDRKTAYEYAVAMHTEDIDVLTTSCFEGSFHLRRGFGQKVVVVDKGGRIER